MHVWPPGDMDGDRAQPCCGIVDTGSARSIAFESKVRELGYQMFCPTTRHVKTLSGESMRVVAMTNLHWTVQGKPDIRYNTELLVLEDQPPGRRPDFDFLLGRDWVRESGACRRNSAVFPKHVFQVSAS